MKLFDTPTKSYTDFKPPRTVRIYTCGITPYDAAHLGHVFTFMTYDLLQRRLEDLGHDVKLVRNITDVDEPIFQRANKMGIPYTELAANETAAFQDVMRALNFRPAFAEPLASDYIQDMADAVERMLSEGFAYRLEEDIYFDTESIDTFGNFSGFSHHLQMGLMRRRGGDPARAGKRHPLDFLLWRGVSDPTDPAAWDSVVGRGRPGWHIECSVMADKLLGTPFDLHGGGTDLIFPHHECEVAQSHALGNAELAHTWVHVSPLSYVGEKMSKSLGNLVFASDLLGTYEPAVIRLALMNYHYRIGGEWLPELLDEATELLRRIYAIVDHATRESAEQLLEATRQALDDDLDTHGIRHALLDFVEQPRDKESAGDGRELLMYTLDLLGLQKTDLV